MKSHQQFNTDLTRRSWLLLATSALTGCGGGSGGGGGASTASAPGTGGTGIYQGSISGFGSVIINGVTYDNSQAVMRLNDVVVSQDQLRLGMVATVRGDRTAGTASTVDVWSLAQGVVSELSAGQFKVAGMNILTSTTTWLYGTTALTTGDYVSVWGLQADVNGHSWTATCVVASSASTDAVSSGLVSIEDGQFKLNGLSLSGAVSSLTDGMLVRVQGTWGSASRLSVVSSKLIDSAVVAQSQGHVEIVSDVEIEGVVTTAPSGTGFMLGSITVAALPASYSPPGAKITVGSRVEVHGAWVGGVLKATQVELEDELNIGITEIKSVLQQFTSLADFVMQGQRCNATGVVLSPTMITALSRKGAVFKVKGVKSGNWLNVSEMELDH